MINKLIALIGVLVITLLLSSDSIYAQTRKGVENNSTFGLALQKAEIKDAKRNSIRQQINSTVRKNQAETASETASREMTLTKNRYRQTLKRLDILNIKTEAMVHRLRVLANRIEQRIALIEESSDTQRMDKTELRSSIKEATALINKAEETLKLVNEDINGIDWESEVMPAQVVKLTVTSMKDIVAMLTEAHRIMVHTIGDIQGLRVGLLEEVELSPTVVEVLLSPTTTIIPAETGSNQE